MALSRVTYPANGTGIYSVPFAYLSKAYVKVYVDGALQTLDTDYEFLSASSIQFPVDPTGSTIEIRRETPDGERLVDFQDGAILNEAGLDMSADQTFHVVQEVRDEMDSKVGGDTDGTVDAGTRRIKNVEDPVDAQDAATKSWVASSTATAVAAAAASASAASASAAAASSSATSAGGSASAAASSATAADSSADSAAASEAAAAAYAASINPATLQPADPQLDTLAGISAGQAAAVAGISTVGAAVMVAADEEAGRVALGLPAATQLEMETGEEAAPRTISPLNVAQAVAALVPTPAAPAILQVLSTPIPAATGTTTIPDDNTEPLSTEGTEVVSVSITPSSVGSTVRLRSSFSAVVNLGDPGADGTYTGGIIVAVFRGATLVGASRFYRSGTGVTDTPTTVAFEFEDSPASTSAVTYSVRIGRFADATAWYVSRSASSATALGSSMANSRFTAEEISA